jgi:hypothetical protein
MEVTRKEIKEVVGDKKFSIRQVSFSDLARSGAYVLRINGFTGDCIPRKAWEANRDFFYRLMDFFKNGPTYKGLKLIRG